MFKHGTISHTVPIIILIGIYRTIIRISHHTIHLSISFTVKIILISMVIIVGGKI